MAPPLYRPKPLWYQRSLTQVAERFSAVLMTDPPPNFRLLPSFTHQEFDAEGIFLNPVSGLHYVLNLFDSADAVLKSAYLGADQQILVIKESVRQSNDRVTYLESRHVGLQRQVDLKTAIDAEMSDMMFNRSEEDWLVVAGLPRLTGDRWQDAARRQVADLFKLVLRVNRVNVPFEVRYVSNPFRYQTNRQNMYNIRMDSVASSKRLREIYSGFFRHNRPVALPPALTGVSVRNKVTPETKVRISILHQFGSIFQESTRGASYKVLGHDSRPLLQTIPPHGSAERMRTYTFIQAVKLLPASFTEEHLIRIYQVVGNQQQGNLKSTFVVLNDDDRDRCLELVKQQRASGRGPGNRRPAVSFAGVASGSGSGMDLAASGSASVDHSSLTVSGAFSAPGSGASSESVLTSLREPPPPPPAPNPSDRIRTRDRSVSSSHNSDQEDRVRGRDRDKGSTKDDERNRDRDRSRDRQRDKECDSDQERDRDRGKGSTKASKGVRRRRSSSSSRERDRKRTKKSKRNRRRYPSSSPSGSSDSGSGTDSSRRSRKEKKSDQKSRER